MDIIEAILTQNGYSANLLYIIDLTDNWFLCSTNHVTQISNKIEQIVSESGYDRVDVIGHSRGGLNLYDYMRFDNGANRVRNWISLAGANNMTCSGSYGSAPNDPTPGNETLYTSIYSNSDTLVSPEMAIIEGARNIELTGLSHSDMRKSNNVFPYVLDALKGTGLNDGMSISELERPSPPTGVRFSSSTDIKP